MNYSKEAEDAVFNELPECGYSEEAFKAIFEWYHR
jgi:hypothetical protein